MDINMIHIGDTLKTLKEFPNDFFDITVTSPPYNKQKAAGGLVKEVKYDQTTDSKNEASYQAEQVLVLEELRRVTKPFGHLFYNHKLRWIDGKMIYPLQWISNSSWDLRQEIIWDRTIAGNIRGWRFWQVEERIYWMQKGLKKGEELESRHAKMTSIWRIRPESDYPSHPAPFPIEIPTRCIYSIAGDKRGWNILDPYCGIGTTLVAAKAMDHNFVGIDNSQVYVYMALQRLDSTSNDAERICSECNLHNVVKSYKQRKKS